MFSLWQWIYLLITSAFVKDRLFKSPSLTDAIRLSWYSRRETVLLAVQISCAACSGCCWCCQDSHWASQQSVWRACQCWYKRIGGGRSPSGQGRVPLVAQRNVGGRYQNGVWNATTHRHCLKYDIMMIEYMHNMREVKDKFVEFVGLPTALENANGAQIRCVAITEE